MLNKILIKIALDYPEILVARKKVVKKVKKFTLFK